VPNFTIDLGGAWKLQRVSSARRFPATVPGCVHMDLLDAGAIEDPFYRDNELKVKWVGEADWIYSRTFSAGDEVLARDRVLLRCKGLDTLAVVTVNGREVGTADNMFRLWEFDIKPVLRRGKTASASGSIPSCRTFGGGRGNGTCRVGAGPGKSPAARGSARNPATSAGTGAPRL